MKKALLPLFILSLALNANAAEYKLCSQGGEDFLMCDMNGTPITGTVKSYHRNGNLADEESYKNGKREGLTKHYYNNGKLEAEFDYKNDKREGLANIYHQNGTLKAKGNFKNGKPEGLAKVYYENGNLKSEENYKDGKREGLKKYYYENGDLKAEIIFKEGKPISGYEYDIHGNKTNISDTHLHNMVKYLK